MASIPVDRASRAPIQPLHAFLLAATVPLFVGAALSDYGYFKSQQVEWSTFASWLIIGGLVCCGAALGCALIALLRTDRRGGLVAISFLLLLATFVIGIVDEFIHARDAWAVMPTGLVLSVVVAVLACVIAWIGFSSLRPWRTT